MTRNRATSGTTGRVVFVGGGPGDPGMLTARATAALSEAAVVLVDPDVSAAVQDAVREANPQAEITPATGEPAEVAKAAVAAAKGGSVVVRLVAGDPYTADAVVNIGYRPTFDESQYWIEAYLFDFSGDLYDRPLTLHFLVRIRPEKKFPGVEALKAQVFADMEEARRQLRAVAG